MAYSRTLDAPRPAAARQVASLRAWLFTVAALVFLMVGVGGATRLTGSGLSITEWQPIVGIVPPLSQADWLEAFAKYQQIPQYHQVNRGMSLDAFKAIFWWEWTHRFLGRLIGAVFLLPLLFFLATGQIPRALLGRLSGIFALGALQGSIGWYMVRSGLADRVDVSQYRLALHLGLAIAIFGALVWVALSVGAGEGRPAAARDARVGGAAAIMLLVLVQILLGAFVAG
jgi:cytochrome c oxidase assembly protein subunit 15